MGYNSGHFRRYINLEFWRGNYEEIIKTGFDFPRIFISSIRYEYQNWKEWCIENQLDINLGRCGLTVNKTMLIKGRRNMRCLFL